MTLTEIKAKIISHYTSKGITSKSLINDLVKRMTNGGDLRRKDTWETALLTIITKIFNNLPEISAPAPAPAPAPVTVPAMRFIGERNGNKIWLGNVA